MRACVRPVGPGPCLHGTRFTGGLPEGEVDQGVQLLSGELVVGEPLQVDDEDLREAPKIQLLSGELVKLTHRAVPTHTHTHSIYYLCI